MRKYSYISIILLTLLSSCIERYFVDENIHLSPRIVIDGSITDECVPQEIVVSLSSSTDYPQFIPYSGCTIHVVDGDGRIFVFDEDEVLPGHYLCTIDEAYLITGSKFKLMVDTPDGNQYESSYEEMLPCPAIDSAYYKVEQQATSDPQTFIDGLQFYIDFEASDYFGPYYRWTLDETYEYHSKWPIKDYHDEKGYHEGFIDYSKMVCYRTNRRDEILTLSTNALSTNKFAGSKVIFVDNQTQRLLYNYRLLIRQLSLSEGAYSYWEKLKKNNKSKEGLFTKQPAMIVGNLVNANDSTEFVLGYFSVSSVTSKELLLSHVSALSFPELPHCTPLFFRYTDFPLEPRPLYTFWALDIADGSWSYAWSAPECFDCTLLGGVVEKPDFFN